MGPSSTRTSVLFTYVLQLLNTVFWGSSYVLSKMVVGEVPPAIAAFIRFGFSAVFALVILAVMAVRDRSVLRIPRHAWPTLTLLGIVGILAYNLLFFVGLNYAPSSDSTMLISTLIPVFTVLLAAILFHTKLARHNMIGLLLALGGSILFFSAAGLGGMVDLSRLMGDVFFVGSALCWSLYTIWGQKILGEVASFTVTTIALVIGAIGLGVWAIPDMTRLDWGAVSATFWWKQVYLALFPTVLANWFYYIGVQQIGSARTSVFLYLVPVVGLVLAMILLKETFTFVQFVGSALMMAGVYLINRKKPLSLSVRTVQKEA